MSTDLEREAKDKLDNEAAIAATKADCRWNATLSPQTRASYRMGFCDGYRDAATLREKEIERWKAEANDKDTVPRSLYNALNADWLDATRAIDNVRAIAKREIENRDAEIATLRARVAELVREIQKLITPPIPAPETKA